jgi:hypothetical protein
MWVIDVHFVKLNFIFIEIQRERAKIKLAPFNQSISKTFSWRWIRERTVATVLLCKQVFDSADDIELQRKERESFIIIFNALLPRVYRNFNIAALSVLVQWKQKLELIAVWRQAAATCKYFPSATLLLANLSHERLSLMWNLALHVIAMANQQTRTSIER